SLPGTEVEALALPLTYLYQHHLAPPALRARALPERYVDMDILDSGSYDRRKALNEVPPLIKGYLRLGGFVGDGAVSTANSTRSTSASWSRPRPSPRNTTSTTSAPPASLRQAER